MKPLTATFLSLLIATKFASGAEVAPASTGRTGISVEDGRKFWSFVPLTKSKITGENESTIDSLLLAMLREKKLTPNGVASKAALMRRISFDLTGLPPEPDDIADFLKDESPQAFDQVVDRLLASPHFGERWGRYWLDLARYADSCGKTRNVAWHHAWRYRDWVVNALNADMPYDAFIRAQIAGDLLDTKDDAERARNITATAFLALGPKAMDELKADIFTMDLVDEQIDVIGRSILGLSVACARCHDHKFDPIPTHDYYALAGILKSTQTLYGAGPMGIKCLHDSSLAVIRDPENLAPAARLHLEKLKAQTQARNDARSKRYRIVRNATDARNQLKKPGADAAKLNADITRMEAEIVDWDGKIKVLESEVKDLEVNPPPQPALAMGATERGKGEDCPVHVRGLTTNLGDKVPRGMLQVIPLPGMKPISSSESGRLQLAQWLTHPSNPLTPRVAVNRVWQHLFGRGIVATPDDYGVNGSRPSHPELLDHLAVQFIEEGWSMKRLIRSIVLSRAYQRASSLPESSGAKPKSIDPDNIALWRQQPRALDAEAFRDAVIAVSGVLDRSPLPRSLVAGQPPFVWQEFFDFQHFFTQSQMEHHHRSLYLPIVRGTLPEMLRLFDFADPSMPTSQRSETIVPAQASFLMNSPWMIEHARHFARRLIKEVPEDGAARVRRLWMLALSREPRSSELEGALAYVSTDDERITAGTNPKPAAAEDLCVERWTSLCQVMLCSTEFRWQW